MKVRAILPVIRYGVNGFKHKGDVFSLPEEKAREQAKLGLVEIIEEKADKKEK